MLRAGQHYFLSCLESYKPRSFVLNYLTVIEMSLFLLWILNINRTNSEDGSTSFLLTISCSDLVLLSGPVRNYISRMYVLL